MFEFFLGLVLLGILAGLLSGFFGIGSGVILVPAYVFLFNLLEDFLTKKINELVKQGIKFQVIGNKKPFSKRLVKILLNSENKTKANNNLHLNLAINYGAKAELIDAMRTTVKKKNPLNQKNLEKNLYTSSCPNPDLLIRTGNTKRLSNFLLWQIAYTEIFFEKKLWPAFNEKDYNRIIYEYKRTKRNFGKI